ncbi:hypothetical protein ABGN05_00595 [Aquibium sp. LZ166]|uniref:Secreted protein n=1 Tax=Aquibium pacificus TaxID=3153579 RepID=A0ABV3SCS2_9HYPH
MHRSALEDQTQRRIVALLVSFAVLAERAAGRSFPVRWFVLVLLRHAQTVALAYVAEVMQATFIEVEERPVAGFTPADAMLLCLRFRALAAVLGALLGPEARPDEDGARIVGADRRAATCVCLLLFVPGKAALRPP